MPDVRISEEPTPSSVTGSETIPMVQAGATVAATLSSALDRARVAFTGDSGSGGVKGMVPAPAAGDASNNRVLCADGTWRRAW